MQKSDEHEFLLKSNTAKGQLECLLDRSAEKQITGKKRKHHNQFENWLWSALADCGPDLNSRSPVVIPSTNKIKKNVNDVDVLVQCLYFVACALDFFSTFMCIRNLRRLIYCRID